MSQAQRQQVADEGWRAFFKKNLPAVLRQEGARLGFVLRALLGAYLAMYVSMVMQLERPDTAMLTVLVVMQPQSGAVLAKSCYRMIGNFAGGLYAVLLFSLFGQAPALLLTGLAAWAGFCVFGSSRQRNVQSYGFVLAGYTACIIALPSMQNPSDIFTPAVLRVSEVFVGIVCAALTSELVFPETVQKILFRAATGRFALFDDFIRTALAGKLPQAEVIKVQQRFMTDVAALDNYGASAAFEAGGLLHKQHVHLFNTGFMTVCTSFHSLYVFSRSISAAPANPVRHVVDQLFAQLSDSMGASGESARTGQAATQTAKALIRYRREADETLLALAARPGLGSADRLNLEACGHLLRRFIDDMCVYLLHYAALTTGSSRRWRHVRFEPSTDKGLALIAALRAGLVLLLVGLFWWGSAWPGGAQAAVFAVIFCALQAAVPHPLRSILFSSLGCTLGVVAGMAYNFLVLPHMTDFETMCAALFPFIAIGPYLLTAPSTARLGRAYNFVFATFANPGLALSIDPTGLTGNALAKMFGIGLAGVMLAIFFPAGGRWWKNRLRNGLLREGVRACRGQLAKILPRFESGIRDLLLQFSSSSLPRSGEKEDMLRRTLAMGELGRVIIDIRRGLGSKRFSGSEKILLRNLLDNIAKLLEKPDLNRYCVLLIDVRAPLAEVKRAAISDAPSQARAPYLPVRRTTGALCLLHILEQALLRAAEEMHLFEDQFQEPRKEKKYAA